MARHILTASLVSAAAAFPIAGCSDRPRRPNVILLVVDCLRADHLGIYGYARATSPNIDRLASTAVVFERAITQGGWTRPAVASLLTSLYPHVHGAVKPGTTLPQDAITLAEALKQKGYLTVGFQANPVIGRSKQFDQGFDRYDERIGARAPTLVNAFLRWLSKNAGSEFFAYLHLMDTHMPYRPPEVHRLKFEQTYRGPLEIDRIRSREQVLDLLPSLTNEDKRHIIAMYDAAIAYVDEEIGRLFRDLDRLGLSERTIIIVTADHGEELFDRGGFEHGHSLQREIVRVPLIIRAPLAVSRQVRVRQLVRHIDVYPTVLGLLGFDRPPSLMGRDLGPSMANPTLDWKLPGLSESMMYGPPQASLEQGSMKLIVMNPAVRSIHKRQLEVFPALRAFAETGMSAFYDLTHDPDERQNIASHPLQARFVAMLAEQQRTGTAGVRIVEAPETLDKEEMDALRSLGYVR